jgi:hypothetical protein
MACVGCQAFTEGTSCSFGVGSLAVVGPAALGEDVLHVKKIDTDGAG